jgi:cold shock protein
MKKTGIILWFDVKKGFGFIRSEGQDVFVHYSKIEAPMGEFRTLNENDEVEFETFEADRGGGKTKLQAKDVKVIKEGQKNANIRQGKISRIE